MYSYKLSRAVVLCFLAAALAGCPGTPEPQIVVMQCSGDQPFGACEAGSSCMAGVCTPTATMCSPTNLAGACPENNRCFSGGCVPAVALCSPSNPAGPCETGGTCFQGGCVATASLCSSSNPAGLCPAGKACELGACTVPGVDPCSVVVNTAQPVIGVDTRGKLTIDGFEFKDSNGSGTLEPYENWRLSDACRAKDLVQRLAVADKVGLMSEGSTIGSGTADGTLAQSTKDRIQNDHIRQALIRLGSRTATELATYLNNVQKLCEAEPFGIPFVVTTDPSHGFGLSTSGTNGAQTVNASSVVTPWPYPLGLGAINDVAVTRQYGDAVRREFMAMGFRWQLGPMADVGTEPRWARVQNVFGENAFAVSNHVRACIQGFQGEGVGGLKNGIAATMKHFPGAGPNEDGKDSHSRPGRYNVFPGNAFEYHSIPFKAAIDVGVAAVMPCYSVFKDQLRYDPEQVGAAFSKGLITDYLKTQLGFNGMVTSDWGTMGNTAYGLEALTQPQRAAVFVKAGSHQLGSDSYTIVKAAYDQGFLTEADIDGAAVKILEMSFRLGLFENPYVDAAATAGIVRSEQNLIDAFNAQKKAIVILKNNEHTTPSGSNIVRYLPIEGGRFVDKDSNELPDPGEYIDDTDADGTVEVFFDGVVDGLAGTDYLEGALGAYDFAAPPLGMHLPIVSVESAAQADIVVARITARKGVYFGLDDGVPLSFDGPFMGTSSDSTLGPAVKDRNRVIDLLRIRDGYTKADGTVVAALKPTLKIVLVMHMDRPGIVKPFVDGLTTLNETPGAPGSYPMVSVAENISPDARRGVDALLVEFGAIDRAVLDVVFNKHVPTTPQGYVYGLARLPMEIPSSDAEVGAQYEDLPGDTRTPTYAVGAGRTF